jgi:hypothetical protein
MLNTDKYHINTYLDPTRAPELKLPAVLIAIHTGIIQAITPRVLSPNVYKFEAKRYISTHKIACEGMEKIK